MERLLNKVYAIIEDEKITKAFCQTGVQPHYSAIGMNFDESKDFENAIILEGVDINEIEIGKSTYIDGIFTSNMEN